AVIGGLRFCGGVSLPAKPPPASALGAAARGRAARAAATQAAYADLVAHDAMVAGLPTPSLAELARTLPDRVDEVRHVLEVGQLPLPLAGLALRAVHTGDALVLEIDNQVGSDLAYDIVTKPIDGAACSSVPAAPYDAMTIAAGHREVRVECAWRDGIALAVTRVETLEIAPLSRWYLDHVAPAAVGIEPRLARGHRVEARPCPVLMPQAVQSGLDRGEIGWRDLVDFYARHRCQTYQFPLGYRAFRSDGERALPAGLAGM
ncbi:MAG TPA: hypothetical protein VGC42_17650, partial [Kofleriaceae bacterium]